MCDRLIQLSFAKIVNSKNEKGGARLRKNLLILRLLQNARNEMKQRMMQSQPIHEDIPVNYEYQVDDNSEFKISHEGENLVDCKSSNDHGDENLSPSSTLTEEEDKTVDSPEKISTISNDDGFSEQFNNQISSSIVCNKRKLVSEVDDHSNRNKKLCISQPIFVGNIRISNQSVVLQFACSM